MIWPFPAGWGRLQSVELRGVDDAAAVLAAQPFSVLVGARVVGQLRRSRLRRPEQRALRGVFAELQAVDAESTRENGHQAPELVSEPVLR